MSRKIKIPTSMSPFVVMVNGVKYEYPAGETVEVPDHIADIIRRYEEGTCPKPAVTATKINMISPSGKQFELTVSDDGKLVATEKVEVDPEEPVFGDPFTFTISGEEFTALEGMTWRQWVESEYNTDTYTCESCSEEHKLIVIDGTSIVEVMGCEELEIVVALQTFKTVEELQNIENGTYVKAYDEINPDLLYGWDG